MILSDMELMLSEMQGAGPEATLTFKAMKDQQGFQGNQSHCHQWGNREVGTRQCCIGGGGGDQICPCVKPTEHNSFTLSSVHSVFWPGCL